MGRVWPRHGGHGRPKPRDRAIHWAATRSEEAAARQGYAVALHNLSFVYKEGKIVPADNVRAYAYFKIGQLLVVGRMRDEAQAAGLEEARRLVQGK